MDLRSKEVDVEPVESDQRLSQLSTQWTILFEAHHGTPEQMDQAFSLLMLRYSGAVHRYLLKAVRHANIVEELDQEFALRFLKGQFRHFDPSRGRFRDYVKRAVHNLMVDYYRGKPPAGHLDTDLEAEIIGDRGLEEFDEQFLESWRKELLDRAWNSLSDLERRTGNPYYKLLKFRVDNPELRSPEMAERLSPMLGRTVSAGGVRQALQRARDKFAEFLIDEVAVSLKTPGHAEIQEELGDLKLLEYCRPALKRKFAQPDTI